jgi:hypothetical protein
MTIHHGRPAFGVIGDEVERRARSAGCGVAAVIAVLQELAQERRGLRARWTRAGRSADSRRRKRALHRRSRVVVQLVVLFRSSVPIRDIGFVPDFPIPGRHLVLPVLLHAVLHPLVNQLAPFAVILGRVRPSDGVIPVRGAGNPGRAIRLRLRRERLRHEADLDERLSARLQIRVENAIRDRPVVHRPSRRVFRVGIRGPPLQSRRSVSGGQHEVGANVHRRAAHRR